MNVELNKAIKANPNDLTTRGQKFFRVLIQARYGTSNPQHQELLLARGLSKTTIKPFHINDCLSEVQKLKEGRWMRSHYDFLCDYVHHNLSSQTITTDSLGESSHVAFGKLEMFFEKTTAYYTYKYQSKNQISYAINATISQALENAKGIASSNASTPISPFSLEEAQKIFGQDGTSSFSRS